MLAVHQRVTFERNADSPNSGNVELDTSIPSIISAMDELESSKAATTGVAASTPQPGVEISEAAADFMSVVEPGKKPAASREASSYAHDAIRDRSMGMTSVLSDELVVTSETGAATCFLPCSKPSANADIVDAINDPNRVGLIKPNMLKTVRGVCDNDTDVGKERS
jgi:hypothetical protein